MGDPSFLVRGPNKATAFQLGTTNSPRKRTVPATASAVPDEPGASSSSSLFSSSFFPSAPLSLSKPAVRALQNSTSFSADEACLLNGAQCNKTDDVLYEIQQDIKSERLAAAEDTPKFHAAAKRTGKRVQQLHENFQEALKRYDKVRAELDTSEFDRANRALNVTHRIALDLYGESCQQFSDPKAECSQIMSQMNQRKWARMPSPECQVGLTTPWDDSLIHIGAKYAGGGCAIL
ncbi:unnamed protein product [Amoebophrya sp. A25]|nr:unnamed protein product [Amoebophrya sp. A25]|eukprot:GSA25T00012760001.1